MSLRLRRGGAGRMSGRALIQAGLTCLVATGCATDPPPALLTIVDPEALAFHDSDLLSDSAKAVIRSYLGRADRTIWQDAGDPEMDRLVGECRTTTAMLNTAALPGPGRSRTVIVDVPGTGLTEFRLTRVQNETVSAPTYTGQARGGEMSILLVDDSIVQGRINTLEGEYNFRSGPFGLITLDDLDSSGEPRLYLIEETAANLQPPGYAEGAQC